MQQSTLKVREDKTRHSEQRGVHYHALQVLRKTGTDVFSSKNV